MRTAAIVAVLASWSVGNASVVEIVWTLTGVLGIYATWDNLRDVRKTMKALAVMNGNNLARTPEMQMIAFGHYRNELFRLMKCCTIIGVGLIAMITPAAVPHQRTTPVQVAITFGLLVLTGLIVSASFLDRRQRDVLLHLSPSERSSSSLPPEQA